jgi:hypothetical protein
VADEELLAATVTSERSHLLEAYRCLTATLFYRYRPHPLILDQLGILMASRLRFTGDPLRECNVLAARISFGDTDLSETAVRPTISPFTNLYDTDGIGTVYKLSPSSGGWTETIRYNFGPEPDGGHPQASLLLDGAGSLYGTTLGYPNSTASIVLRSRPNLFMVESKISEKQHVWSEPLRAGCQFWPKTIGSVRSCFPLVLVSLEL